MKEELEKKKKTNKLKEFAKAAGAGGIKNSLSEEDKKSVSSGVKRVVKTMAQTISGVASEPLAGKIAEKALEKNNNLNKLKERQKEVENKTGAYQVRSLNKGNEKKDAAAEKQVASRYKNDFDPRKVVPEDGPQPGVTGKGTFSLYIKNKKKK